MSRRGENIFKRKDGRWEARYIHHYENGKAKYRYVYGKTYTEAKAKRAKEQMHASIPIIGNKQMTAFNELSEVWLEAVKLSVKESTYTRYDRIVRKYLNRYLNEKPLMKLEAQHIRQLIETLLHGGGVHNTPLSVKTVSDILCVLKAVYKYGAANGYPCADLSCIKCTQRKPHRANILTTDDRLRFEQFLTNANDRTSVGVLLALYTGIRIGELCGLRWEDVDFPNCTISVRRTVERITNLDVDRAQKTKIIISEPKTDSSVRVIPFPRFLYQQMERIRGADTCYVVTGTEQPTEPHQLYVRYKKLAVQNQLYDYTFHDLRHTFATRCVEAGFDAKSLSEILGHASVATTLAVYVHPTLKQKRELMERLSPCPLQSDK